MSDRSIPGLAFTGTVIADNQLIVLGTGCLPDGTPVTVGIELNAQQRHLVRSRIDRLDQRTQGPAA